MALHAFSANIFKLDGGAMFGVVPKSMWNKINPADENNMVTWSGRCMIFEVANRIFLFDTGLGSKQDSKFKSHFYVRDEDDIENELLKIGYKSSQITDVVFTHFHFDHCGGAVKRNSDGSLELTFPNAQYWSSKSQWNNATNPNARELASYLPENINPIYESGKLQFVEENNELEQFFKLYTVSGHTKGQILPLINFNNRKVFFASDLFPSHAHIRMPYIMAYDTNPLQTLEDKETVLDIAFKENWTIVFGHDPQYVACTLKKDSKWVSVNELFESIDFNS